MKKIISNIFILLLSLQFIFFVFPEVWSLEIREEFTVVRSDIDATDCETGQYVSEELEETSGVLLKFTHVTKVIVYNTGAENLVREISFENRNLIDIFDANNNPINSEIKLTESQGTQTFSIIPNNNFSFNKSVNMILKVKDPTGKVIGEDKIKFTVLFFRITDLISEQFEPIEIDKFNIKNIDPDSESNPILIGCHTDSNGNSIVKLKIIVEKSPFVESENDTNSSNLYVGVRECGKDYISASPVPKDTNKQSTLLFSFITLEYNSFLQMLSNYIVNYDLFKDRKTYEIIGGIDLNTNQKLENGEITTSFPLKILPIDLFSFTESYAALCGVCSGIGTTQEIGDRFIDSLNISLSLAIKEKVGFFFGTIMSYFLKINYFKLLPISSNLLKSFLTGSVPEGFNVSAYSYQLSPNYLAGDSFKLTHNLGVTWQNNTTGYCKEYNHPNLQQVLESKSFQEKIISKIKADNSLLNEVSDFFVMNDNDSIDTYSSSVRQYDLGAFAFKIIPDSTPDIDLYFAFHAVQKMVVDLKITVRKSGSWYLLEEIEILPSTYFTDLYDFAYTFGFFDNPLPRNAATVQAGAITLNNSAGKVFSVKINFYGTIKTNEKL